MSPLREKFFWESYGKFAVAMVLGSGVATLALGVPADVSVRLAAGAVLGFPVAFGFAMRRPPLERDGPSRPPPAP